MTFTCVIDEYGISVYADSPASLMVTGPRFVHFRDADAWLIDEQSFRRVEEWKMNGTGVSDFWLSARVEKT